MQYKKVTFNCIFFPFWGSDCWIFASNDISSETLDCRGRGGRIGLGKIFPESYKKEFANGGRL